MRLAVGAPRSAFGGRGASRTHRAGSSVPRPLHGREMSRTTRFAHRLVGSARPRGECAGLASVTLRLAPSAFGNECPGDTVQTGGGMRRRLERARMARLAGGQPWLRTERASRAGDASDYSVGQAIVFPGGSARASLARGGCVGFLEGASIAAHAFGQTGGRGIRPRHASDAGGRHARPVTVCALRTDGAILAMGSAFPTLICPGAAIETASGPLLLLVRTLRAFQTAQTAASRLELPRWTHDAAILPMLGLGVTWLAF